MRIRSFCGSFRGARRLARHASWPRLRRRRPRWPRRSGGGLQSSRPPSRPFLSPTTASRRRRLLGQWKLERASRPANRPAHGAHVDLYRSQDRPGGPLRFGRVRRLSGRRVDGLFSEHGRQQYAHFGGHPGTGHSDGKTRRQRIRAPRHRRRLLRAGKLPAVRARPRPEREQGVCAGGRTAHQRVVSLLQPGRCRAAV